MRTLFLFFCFLSFLTASGQETESLPQYPVKGSIVDPAFNKEFSRIIRSYANNFAELKTNDRLISIIDTSYDIQLNFKEKHSATLKFEKSDINLSLSFGLDAKGERKMFNEICSVLPAGFVYTREYDALTKISNYTFFKKHGTIAGYPEKIYLQTDINNTVVLGFIKFR